MTTKKIEFVDQPGPKIPLGTASVYKDGKTLRISPIHLEEMGNPDRVEASVDEEKRILLLKPSKKEGMRIVKTHPKANSGLIWMSGILPHLKVSAEDAPGDYRAEVVKGTLFVYFGERL